MIAPLLNLDPLPYPPGALQPALSERQVTTHYALQARYVQQANEVLQLLGHDLDRFGQAPSSIWERYRFARNGALLHALFWPTFVPGGSEVTQRFTQHLTPHTLRSDVLDSAMAVQGSGWVFLSLRIGTGETLVHSTQNHYYDWENLIPLLVLDVWEHAYYLDYLGKRDDYVRRMLALVDWPLVERRLLCGRRPFEQHLPLGGI